jgi:putative DNA primase/helicase
MSDESQRFAVQLTPDALMTFQEWETEVEMMLCEGGQMEIMRDWGGKLAGETLRLAAVLHCVENDPASYINGVTIRAAIEIARYLVPHAEAVLEMMQVKENSRDDDARYVLRWIERHGRREFTKTEAQHHGKRRFPKANSIDAPIGELTRRGYIRLQPAKVTGPGRPPSPTYEVNPAVFANENNGKNSHNSRNMVERSADDNSGNIGSASRQSENANRVEVTI